MPSREYLEAPAAAQKRRPGRPEDRLQMRVRMYLDAALPAPGWWSSVAMERKQSPIAGQRQKARGVKAGLPDVMIWYLRMFLPVELKVGGNDTSDAQDRFGAAMQANGFGYFVVRSVVDLDNLLRNQGVPVEPSMRIAAMHHDAALGTPAPVVARKRVGKPPASRATKRAFRFARMAQRP